MLEQNWFIPHPLCFDDNKVFKVQLGILTSIQVCKIIKLRTDEEKIDYSASEVQTLVLMEELDSEEVNSKESQPLVI